MRALRFHLASAPRADHLAGGRDDDWDSTSDTARGIVVHMWERTQKLLDRFESRLALWLALSSSGAFGVLTAWLASATGWINQYGPIAWLATGALGALVFASLLLLIAIVRSAFIRGSAMRKWSRDVDSINPLDSDFHSKRIYIRDVANPIEKSIESKTFTRCEILGPANVIFTGDHGNLLHNNLFDCDIVLVKTGVIINNVIQIKNTTIQHSKIYNLTIFVQPGQKSAFDQMGAQYISLGSDE